MDAHPVPQNVTQFQFKLIGDMNLKQFGYLAAGVGFAYLMFIFVAGIAPIIAWPIIVVSAGLGIAFAFLPIQDRPLDHWVKAFLKAIYNPTSRIWKKNGKSYKEDPSFKTRLSLYLTLQRTGGQPLIPLAALPTPSLNSMEEPIQAPAISDETLNATPSATSNTISTPEVTPVEQALKAVSQLSQSLPKLTTPTQPPKASSPLGIPTLPSVVSKTVPDLIPVAPKPISPQLPTSEELSQTVSLGKKAQSLQVKIIESERQLAQIKTQAAGGIGNPAAFTAEFNQVFEHLQELVKEASDIGNQLDSLTGQPATTKPVVKVEVVKSRPNPTPIVLTSTPNVISGIVVDGEGNYLEGVVVVIHDKDGLPVRALKTNKLGQFTGSTPLSNGTFNIELEKDNYAFDVQQIELSGKVIPPLMVNAKTAASS